MLKTSVLYIFYFISFFFFGLKTLIAQNYPPACSTIPSGWRVSSESILEGIEPINCGISEDKTIKLKDAFAHLEQTTIVFGVENLSQLPSGDIINVHSEIKKQFPHGETWIAVKGEENGRAVLYCSKYEFLDTSAPLVNGNLCEADMIELIIDIPNARDRLELNMGNVNLSNPLQGRLNYRTNYSVPHSGDHLEVYTYYIRNNVKVCESDKALLSKTPPPTLLTSLEGLFDPSEFKIRYVGNIEMVQEIEAAEVLSNGLSSWQSVSRAQAGEGDIISLDPQKQYCFRLKAENNCQEIRYSQNILCSMAIDHDVISSTSIQLHWNSPKYPEQASISTQISGYTNRPQQPLVSQMLEAEAEEYTATDLKCGEKYYFKITKKYPEVTFNGVSYPIFIATADIQKEISKTLTDSHPRVLALADFNGNRIEISIDEDPDLIYKVNLFQYNVKTETYEPQGSHTQLQITFDFKSSEIPCFKYQIEDVCNVTSGLSDEFCAVYLKGVEFETLQWNGHVPNDTAYQSDAQYKIEYWDNQSNTYREYAQVYGVDRYFIQDFWKDWEEPSVKWRVTQWGNGVEMHSNEVEYFFSPKVFNPTVFTPNNDFEPTDNFSVYAKFLKEGSYRIFNRLGTLVYKSENLKDKWDGRDFRSQREVENGTYLFILEGKTYQNQAYHYKGSIQVVR